MATNRSPAELAAENYYDNPDADRFHEAIWGGENIHVGLYGRSGGSDIAAACQRTNVAMADCIAALAPDAQVIDLGAGYGGAARYLANRFGCKVTCLNISEVQNERNRRLNRAQDLHQRIAVVHGSFLDIPAAANSVDLVWSQGAFLYGARRERIVDEIYRVLKPGGELIFSDQMQADGLPPGMLNPLLARFRVESLASPLWYRREFARKGFQQAEWRALTPELLQHYTAVRAAVRQQYDKLGRSVSAAFMDRMLVNLDNWVSAAHAGYLCWGIFHFRKTRAS